MLLIVSDESSRRGAPTCFGATTDYVVDPFGSELLAAWNKTFGAAHGVTRRVTPQEPHYSELIEFLPYKRGIVLFGSAALHRFHRVNYVSMSYMCQRRLELCSEKSTERDQSRWCSTPDSLGSAMKSHDRASQSLIILAVSSAQHTRQMLSSSIVSAGGRTMEYHGQHALVLDAISL